MSKILDFYNNSFIRRFDKEEFVPYLLMEDFPNLKRDEIKFDNSRRTTISGFRYYYGNPREDHSILFLPGIGPGHAAYMREIELLASKGYEVYTIDYMGCGESGGESLYSISEPTRDTTEFLDRIESDKEMIVIGHSLGGHTAINVLMNRKEITKGVIISGFLNIKSELSSFVPLPFLFKSVVRKEKMMDEKYFSLDQLEFLKNTDKSITFIHSKDDPMCSYKANTKKVEGLENPNLKFIITNGRKHNPNYTDESLKYMNETLGKLRSLKNREEKEKYSKDLSAIKMTNQDIELWDRVLERFKQD